MLLQCYSKCRYSIRRMTKLTHVHQATSSSFFSGGAPRGVRRVLVLPSCKVRRRLERDHGTHSIQSRLLDARLVPSSRHDPAPHSNKRPLVLRLPTLAGDLGRQWMSCACSSWQRKRSTEPCQPACRRIGCRTERHECNIPHSVRAAARLGRLQRRAAHAQEQKSVFNSRRDVPRWKATYDRH